MRRLFFVRAYRFLFLLMNRKQAHPEILSCERDQSVYYNESRWNPGKMLKAKSAALKKKTPGAARHDGISCDGPSLRMDCYFIYTAGMSSAFKRRGHECFYKLHRFLTGNKTGRNANHVGVVVLPRQSGYFVFPGNGCADFLMLIRRDGNAVCASANQNAQIIFFFLD